MTGNGFGAYLTEGMSLDIGGGAQDGALEIGVGKIAAEKLHAAGLRFPKVGAGKNGLGHVRVAQVSFLKIGAGKIRARKARFAQIAPGEICISQNRAAQVNAAQIGVGKVGACQIGALPPFAHAEKALMRFQNIGKALAIVLDAFCFAKRHKLPHHP
ncbi:MAG: hypothetical protein PVS2B2_01670 [Candidatus Acidiferrum sp.]